MTEKDNGLEGRRERKSGDRDFNERRAHLCVMHRERLTEIMGKSK